MVVALRLQYGIWLGVVDCAVGGLEHPLEHLAAVSHIAGDVEGRQLLVAVEQQPVELVAFQEFLLNSQRAVALVVADGLCMQLIVGVVVEGVEATLQVGDVGPSKNGRDGGAASDVAVEHTVHHHSLDAGGDGRQAVVAHNAAYVTASGDGGERVTVDYAGRAVKEANQSACVTSAAHRAIEDAHIIDASRTVGSTGNSAGGAGVSANVRL